MEAHTTHAFIEQPIIEQGCYLARLMDSADPTEVRAYQKLRYDYLVHHKGWLPPDPEQPGLETDCYDNYAWHLGVFDNTGAISVDASHHPPLLAYLRVLPWTAPCGFMLDHEFRCLLTDEQRLSLPRTRAVELSRLVIAPGVCNRVTHHNDNKKVAPHVLEVLLKLLYHLSLQQGITHYYIVVEELWLKLFARRFHLPFQALGSPYTFPDGTKTVVAQATRADLEQYVAGKDPTKYHWYQQLNTDQA